MSSYSRKICVITSARSEYGLLRYLIQEIRDTEELRLQLIVTGGHLLEDQGRTIDQIRRDGFEPDACIDPELDTSSEASIAASMGRLSELLAKTYQRLKPDYIMVLGDRYELLPICSTAYIMRIPIIHISGGDVTLGAIDDGIRNAITMLASYHFPGTRESADRIVRMRGTDSHVWIVGELGLDAFHRESLLSRQELASEFRLDLSREWVLLTCHPETRRSETENMDMIRACMDALMENESITVIATYANADFCGYKMNQYLDRCSEEYGDRCMVFPSLGNRRYLSLMKQVSMVIGNSSSGIIEAPYLKIKVINIGDRQRGRHLCNNIFSCAADRLAIRQTMERAKNTELDGSDADFWGDGHTTERIMTILLEELGLGKCKT